MIIQYLPYNTIICTTSAFNFINRFDIRRIIDFIYISVIRITMIYMSEISFSFPNTEQKPSITFLSKYICAHLIA